MNPPSNKPFASRITSFRKALGRNNIDAALISKKESIFYYTGLASQHPTEREAYLLISNSTLLLYHSPFIETPAQIPAIAMSPTHPLSKVFSSFFTGHSIIGIEKTNLSVSEYERTQSYVSSSAFETIDTIIATQRLIKDHVETLSLRKSGTIASQTLRYFKKILNSDAALGISEIEVAHRIDYRLKQLGADEPAFPTIVAFDQNSAKPHHRPSSAKLKTDSIILIDMGASLNQYKSDLTRTWLRNNSSNPLFNQVKSIVKQSYHQAKMAATPEVAASDIDSAARTVINQAGFADKFIHTTGHGIGLEAHELPHISSTDTAPLSPGLVFTIEPGIYLPGQFGYRHENTFLMTEDGPLNLTSSRTWSGICPKHAS